VTPLVICICRPCTNSHRTFLRNSDWNSSPIFTPENITITQSLFLSGVFKFAVAKNREERRDTPTIRVVETLACASRYDRHTLVGPDDWECREGAVHFEVEQKGRRTNWNTMVYLASHNLDPAPTCANLRLRRWRRPSNKDAQLRNGIDSSRRCPSAD